MKNIYYPNTKQKNVASNVNIRFKNYIEDIYRAECQHCVMKDTIG